MQSSPLLFSFNWNPDFTVHLFISCSYMIIWLNKKGDEVNPTSSPSSVFMKPKRFIQS